LLVFLLVSGSKRSWRISLFQHRKTARQAQTTPRPDVTEPRDVTRVFELISAPWARAGFSDVVGFTLRFDALTIPRPGMVNEKEWSEVDSRHEDEDRLGPRRPFVTVSARNPAQCLEADRPSPVRVWRT
jgi:hypothetical protein